FFSPSRSPPSYSPLFPYTTLFRSAIIIETTVCSDGLCKPGTVYRGLVRNHAKLDYDSAGAWLEGGAMPPKIAALKELAGQVKLQDRKSTRLNSSHVAISYAVFCLK